MTHPKEPSAVVERMKMGALDKIIEAALPDAHLLISDGHYGEAARQIASEIGVAVAEVRAAFPDAAEPGLCPRTLADVEHTVELMGEALFSLSGRLRGANFFDPTSDALQDLNRAAYDRVGKAWDKLTDAIRSLSPTTSDDSGGVSG